MNKKLLSTFMIISIISIAVPPAFADTAVVDIASICKERSDCDFTEITNPLTLRDLLDSLGIPQCDEIDIPSAACDALTTESLAEGFTVVCELPDCDPVEFADEADVTFEIVQDTGNFFYSYGFCHTDSVGILDPITQRQSWAEACLGDSRTVEVFDDDFNDVGDTNTVGIDVNSELFFWIIPNNDFDAFTCLNCADDFYPPDHDSGQEFRSVLFTAEDPNPDEKDQWLAFTGLRADPDDGDDIVDDPFTMFGVEDLTRDPNAPAIPPASDEDFTDLVFLLDFALDPIPFCDLFPMDPTCVGGELLSVDTTSLLVAGATSSIAWYMYAFTALGIGAFWFARNPYNVRNVKTIIGDYLDRFSKTD